MITFLPYKIEAKALQNGLGELTEEFVSGFEDHKVESVATIVVLNEKELQLNYNSGTTAKCSRK